VIAHGAGRDEALRRLDAALSSTAILGVTTNVGFLRRLIADDDVRAGRLDTGLVERRVGALVASEVPDAALVAAAVLPLLDATAVGDPWQAAVGWRHGGPSWVCRRLDVQGRGTVSLSVRQGAGSAWDVVIDAAAGAPRPASVITGPAEVAVHVTLDGVTTPMVVHRDRGGIWVGVSGSAWLIRDHDPRSDHLRPDAGAAGHGPIRSPMPGRVTAVLVAEGDHVSAGQAVAIVEAMKMEHTLRASADGVVTAVHARQGQSVGLDEPVVTITAAPAPPDHSNQNLPEEKS
jgi:acetyl-CoA/propionyl-CoA carboxylase biotin carboxyl carrier protein